MRKQHTLVAFYYYTCIAVIIIIFFPDHSYSQNSNDYANPTISRIVIKIDKVSDNKEYWIKMAKDLISLREGIPLSPESLELTLNALKSSQKFRSIHIESMDENDQNDQIAIVFILVPFERIKSIKIYDPFPLSDLQVLNTMTIYPGDGFIKEKLYEQEKLISELFMRSGYISPRIKTSGRQDPEDGQFLISVEIVKGPFLEIRKIDLIGNQAVLDMQLKLRMKVWASSLFPGENKRYIHEDFINDIKSLTAYYRKNGFPDVMIDYDIEKVLEEKDVFIKVKINEGRHYHIKFKGNSEFSAKTLIDDMVIFKEGNKNNYGLEKSIRKIKSRYRMIGHLKTDVKVEEKTKTNEKKKTRKLRIIIDEGPRSIVNSITISGNTLFDDEFIKKQMITGRIYEGAFVPETLKKDLNVIKSLYVRQGCMDIKVNDTETWSKDKKQVDIYIKIEEGSQLFVSSIEISGDTGSAIEEYHRLILMDKGKPFQKHLVRKDKNIIAAHIFDSGYPHVKVRDFIATDDHSKVRITYMIDKGPYIEMGETYFSGNFRTNRETLADKMVIKEGDPFSMKKILMSQRNIREIETINYVRRGIIGLKEKAEKAILFFDIEEKRDISDVISKYPGQNLVFQCGTETYLNKSYRDGSRTRTGRLNIKNSNLNTLRLLTNMNLISQSHEPVRHNLFPMAYNMSPGRIWIQFQQKIPLRDSKNQGGHDE